MFYKLCQQRPAYIDEKSFCDLVNKVMGPIRTKQELIGKAALTRVILRLYKTFAYSRSGVKEYLTEAGTLLGIIQTLTYTTRMKRLAHGKASRAYGLQNTINFTNNGYVGVIVFRLHILERGTR
eukprot:gb/GECG01012531.1/.p1 GENE.gb/GECG01012531.1/~~gb/GECG01012531.1/.p1  ORF type:complete len:124 (+),score=3.35 gb/GECG01012531.1/:1-372(+)